MELRGAPPGAVHWAPGGHAECSGRHRRAGAALGLPCVRRGAHSVKQGARQDEGGLHATALPRERSVSGACLSLHVTPGGRMRWRGQVPHTHMHAPVRRPRRRAASMHGSRVCACVHAGCKGTEVQAGACSIQHTHACQHPTCNMPFPRVCPCTDAGRSYLVASSCRRQIVHTHYLCTSDGGSLG